METNCIVGRDKLMKEAEQAAIEAEQKYGGCAQCALVGIKAALKDNLVSDEIFKAATGLAAGVSLTGNVCGAVTGGILCLSAYGGRSFDELDVPEKKRNAYRLGNLLIDRFIAEYGSINCSEIQKKIMGRSYKMSDPEEFQAFDQAGGHSEYCPKVCGNGAKWTIDILCQEGYLD